MNQSTSATAKRPGSFKQPAQPAPESPKPASRLRRKARLMVSHNTPPVAMATARAAARTEKKDVDTGDRSRPATNPTRKPAISGKRMSALDAAASVLAALPAKDAAAGLSAGELITRMEAGGLWTDEIPENVVQGIAHALLAEILRRRADEDDVIFGDPAQYHALVAESREHFAQANALDPSDEYSSYHAFFLGIPGKKEESETLDGDMDVPLIPGGPLPGEA